ncbi:SGNH/GDSL hydrolase family protein [Longispora sp. K20-0274]|uniref:SGNH/GDSL hydrolase family protein n=1 Tax=Longispora sp. K20-0274 TaxID=3088255 RepID=UPI00399AA0F7
MTGGDSQRGYDRYVALGDSFTEGLGDPGPGGTVRGWADRLAGHLAARDPGLRYANLAVRGRLLGQVVSEQVPVAARMRPGLVTFCAGGNDLLRPGGDPDALAEVLEVAVRRLRGTGADVVLFTGFDTGRQARMRMLRGKIATYNMHIRALADAHDCRVVDLWPMTVLDDPRAWGEDRLHLGPEGHRRVALRACEVLGLPVTEDWREPWPAAEPRDWATARRTDLRWAREYLVPWLGRRLRGQSSGDGRTAKRPDLDPVVPVSATR